MLPVMRGIVPAVTTAPAPPTTWAPKLWPIKWKELNGAPVFSIRKSMKALEHFSK